MKNSTRILLVDDDAIFKLLAHEELIDACDGCGSSSRPDFHFASDVDKGAKLFIDLLTLHLSDRREIGDLFLISDLNMPSDNEGLDLLHVAKIILEDRLKKIADDMKDSVRASVHFALLTSADLKEVARKINGDPILADVALINKNAPEDLAKFVFPNLKQEAA